MCDVLEPLGKNVKIFVSHDYKFTMDTILLANFSSSKKVNNALELCCGSGAVSLIWCRDSICKNIVSVDIQSKACDLLKKSVKFNKFENIVNVVNKDLNDLDGYSTLPRFDMIAVNPPYKVIGTGEVNKNLAKITARHEKDCTIDDILRVSSKLLNFSGSFYMCCRTQRMAEIINRMKKYKIEPKRLQLVQQRIDVSPKLFLIQGCLGGKEYLEIMPTLLVESSSNNEYSDIMKKVYGEYIKSKETGL